MISKYARVHIEGIYGSILSIDDTRSEIESLQKGISAHERAIDKRIDDVMRDAQLPIEDEMLRIFEEQEEEVLRNLEQFRSTINKEFHDRGGYGPLPNAELRQRFLTADSLMDFPRWIGETASRLAGYVRGTMQSAWCLGYALIGQECTDEILEQYVQEVIDTLTPLNEEITRTSKRKIEELVHEAISKEKSIDEIKSDFFELFASWKRHRPHGVSVFNVTYPFNNALFRLYHNAGIEFKTWVTQGDEKVRTEHAEVNGVVVRLHDTFVVGGARMLYPGDLSVIATHPHLLFGCRCSHKPVLDPNFPNV